MVSLVLIIVSAWASTLPYLVKIIAITFIDIWTGTNINIRTICLCPFSQMPSSSGQPGQGKKIGHRGVDASGETTYKKVLWNAKRLLYYSGKPLDAFWFVFKLIIYVFSSAVTNCRPHHQRWKVPSSWESVTQSATWAPSRREMCWCKISTWWKASFSPGQYFTQCKMMHF